VKMQCAAVFFVFPDMLIDALVTDNPSRHEWHSMVIRQGRVRDAVPPAPDSFAKMSHAKHQLNRQNDGASLSPPDATTR
jgi:hypothetical protein